MLAAPASLGALVTPEGDVLAPLVGAGAVTDAPLLAPVLGDAEASLGVVAAAPVLDGVVTDAPVLGDEVLGDAALGDVLLGDVLLGALVVVLGIVVLDPVLLGAACFAAAVSAIAPFEVLVVVPVLDFFEVSLGVVCCAAAGIDSAVSRTAASAYRCAMMVSPASVVGSAACSRRTAYQSPHRPCTRRKET